jgi:S-adenosylmethionine:tRNA ribosyltransferase-isomerase
MTNDQSLDDVLAPYDYVVSPSLIAQSPANPRDTANLLVYNRETKQTSFDIFRNIIEYLPENCVLVCSIRPKFSQHAFI